MRSNKIFSAIVVGLLSFGAVASADDAGAKDKKPPAPETSSGSAAADVHAGTGYEKHAVVGEAASFPANTKVFVVSVITGANGTQVKHVWKKDGAELWTATLNVGSEKWTTSSRRMLTATGSYEVDVVGADGNQLGKVEFAIQ